MYMFKIELKRFTMVMLSAFVFFVGANLSAQDNDMNQTQNQQQNDTYKDNAQKWTTQLNQKVNLTQDQQTRIQGILVDYQNAKANTDMSNYDQLQKTYDQRIQTVLNDDQKQSYKDYSENWWKMMAKPTTGTTEKDKDTY